MDTPRILLIDDDIKVLNLMATILQKVGHYEVTTEHRSARALATAREVRPALILLDVDMPGLDGGEVARLINADADLRGTPIMFCTSLLTREEAEAGLVNRGGVVFLAKPVLPSTLLSAVAEQIGARSHAA